MSIAYAPAARANGFRIVPSGRPTEHERRRRKRFRLIAQAQYSVAGIEARAVIRNISSGGILLKTDDILRVGQRIQVFVDWPVLLENRCPLRLVIHGIVLRSDLSGTAVGLTKYDFRIRPKASAPGSPA